MLKKCHKCHKKKKTTSFHKNRSTPDGLDGYCKICRKVSYTAYRRTDKGRATRAECQKRHYHKHRACYTDKSATRNRKRKYGIDRVAFERMVHDQNGVCAICKNPDSCTLSVDHDHITGEVRGLLCRKCNSGIGHLNDDVAVLSAAIAYLQRKRSVLWV